MLKFTVINHEFRRANNLSCNEYILADMIHNLSNNRHAKVHGWCYMSKESMSNEIGVGYKTIFNYLLKLEANGFIERDPITKFLRTTVTWCGASDDGKNDSVKITPIVQNDANDSVKITPSQCKNYTPDSVKITHYNSIYNNIDTNKDINSCDQLKIDTLDQENKSLDFQTNCENEKVAIRDFRTTIQDEPMQPETQKEKKVAPKKEKGDFGKFIDIWREVETIKDSKDIYNFNVTRPKDAANGTKIVKALQQEINGTEFSIDDTLKHFLILAYDYFKTWKTPDFKFTPSMCLSQYNQIKTTRKPEISEKELRMRQMFNY